MKLSDVFLLFITGLEGVRSPATISTYKSKISTITNVFGDIQVSDITPEMAQEKYNTLMSKYSYKTICSFLNICNAALKNAVNMGLVNINPFSGVHVEYTSRFSPVMLHVDDINQIKEVIRRDNVMLFLPVLLATETGLKRAEVLGLTWGNVDFSKSEISIIKNKVSSKNRIYTACNQSVQKRIKMSTELASVLLTVKDIRRNKGVPVTDADKICLTKGYQVVEPTYFNKCFRNFVRQHKELPQGVRFSDFGIYYKNQFKDSNNYPKNKEYICNNEANCYYGDKAS